MRPPRNSGNSYFCGKPDSDYCDMCSDDRMSFEVRDGASTSDSSKLKVLHIYVFGLEADDEIEIEREWKDNCDPIFGPWLHCGKPLKLTCQNPEAFLTVPGCYKTKHPMTDLDSENVRVQVTEVDIRFAELRLREQALCCCSK